MSNYTLYLGDCLEYMKGMPDKSVDAIITDLPYGTTACSWDEIIPFEPMWEQVKRIDRGVFVTTASQPFTSKLVMSNLDWFKYELIWEKNVASNFMTYKFMVAKKHENILVFGNGRITYNPIMEDKQPSSIEREKYKFGNRKKSEHYKNDIPIDTSKRGEKMYPTSVKKFNREVGLHPTQKPVDLYNYLIRTYTNEGDTVIDICMGSGTTGVACMQLGRNFIGIELNPEYMELAKKRINKVVLPMFAETLTGESSHEIPDITQQELQLGSDPDQLHRI